MTQAQCQMNIHCYELTLLISKLTAVQKNPLVPKLLVYGSTELHILLLIISEKIKGEFNFHDIMA